MTLKNEKSKYYYINGEGVFGFVVNGRKGFLIERVV